MGKDALYACIAGFLLDLIFGDPQWIRCHPIRLIGTLISFLEKKLRRLFRTSDRALFVAGIVLVVLVCGISFAAPYALLYICYGVHRVLGIVVESVLCYFIFATKALKTESMQVYHALETKDLSKARNAVGRIVGRDTDRLDSEGVAKAAVETVAENTSDGVIAPMLFLILGGAPLGYLYKAINTMDSMVGYKNETYLYFGRAAAKLDDIANFIPARFSALLMWLAATLHPKFSGADAGRIFWRDRYQSTSPNSGQTESVCAGALQIQLLGSTYYFGVLHEKPTVGDAKEMVGAEKIRDVNVLMYATAFLSMLLLAIVKWLLLL